MIKLKELAGGVKICDMFESLLEAPHCALLAEYGYHIVNAGTDRPTS